MLKNSTDVFGTELTLGNWQPNYFFLKYKPTTRILPQTTKEKIWGTIPIRPNTAIFYSQNHFLAS